MKQRLILHIGLHKTGTTSFQIACSQSRKALREFGIEYPEAPELTAHTNLHVMLPSLFQQPGGCESVLEILRKSCDSDDINQIILSSEDLSEFFVKQDLRTQAENVLRFFDAHFSDWHAYVVIRDRLEMLKATLLQSIESIGYPVGKSLLEKASVALENQTFKCRELKSLFGSRITGIDFNDLKGASYCSSLLQRMTGLDVKIQEIHANSSSEKTITLLLSAGIRKFWTDFLKAPHPYCSEVNEAVSRSMSSITMNPDEETHLLTSLSSHIDSVSRQAFEKSPASASLMEMINS
jgi:hypothetical protein